MSKSEEMAPPVPAPDVADPPRIDERYRIEKEIGRGGMGRVFVAHDRKLGRDVAIKVLAPGLHGEEALRRFAQEARATCALNHANILDVHDIGTHEGSPYIVSELLHGSTLRERLECGPLSIKEASGYALQLAQGLSAAHEKGIVHRDLKPENLFITEEGRLKILDFGIAKLVAPLTLETGETLPSPQPHTGTDAILGTVGYMSPEQVRGQPADQRSDVFSFGVIVYELLAGRSPFERDTAVETGYAILNDDPPPLHVGVPATLRRLVERCLAKRPEDRYPTAVELAADLAKLTRAAGVVAPLARGGRAIAIAGILIALAAVVAIAWVWKREAGLRWARGPALAEMARLVAKDDPVAAFVVARRALEIAPDDPQVLRAWANLTAAADVVSVPPGADVAIRSYLRPDGAWVALGRTPISKLRVPFALLRWRLERDGFDTLEVGQDPEVLELHLTPAGSAPPGMMLVPAGAIPLESTGEKVTLPDFWLDRNEVSNRQYQAFVDAGGYRKREFWKEPFTRNGKPLAWERAMAEFLDTTGRPGPSGWSLGHYPEGQGDLPVGGVSWYEAVAYAAWAGRQLPTAYHWHRAAGADSIFSEILVASNFSGKGPSPVGAGGLGPYGTRDMAGNVKEWCWNEATAGRRYLLGGGWNEAVYMFRDEDAQQPFERRATFGFRCMLPREPVAPRLAMPIRTFERDVAKLKPVSDEVYAAYKHLYDYDPTPLDARIESVDDGNPAWREERVSIRAAYGNERLPIHLFIPRNARPPWQAVVYFPGADAVITRSSDKLWLQLADFHPRSGRVLVHPIYQSTYERHASWHEGMDRLREIMIQIGKDVRRTVDYLETRPDIDSTRIALQGLSLGAQLAPVYLAIEPRFRTGVLFSGGFETWNIPPECDPVNFAPHVRTPVLMVNGREDFDLPYATKQVPLFRALGTPAADKKHVVLEGGHIPPHAEDAIRVILDWLDARMGPVR